MPTGSKPRPAYLSAEDSNLRGRQRPWHGSMGRKLLAELAVVRGRWARKLLAVIGDSQCGLHQCTGRAGALPTWASCAWWAGSLAPGAISCSWTKTLGAGDTTSPGITRRPQKQNRGGLASPFVAGCWAALGICNGLSGLCSSWLAAHSWLALGIYGIQRVQQLGQDDHYSWVLIPAGLHDCRLCAAGCPVCADDARRPGTHATTPIAASPMPHRVDRNGSPWAPSWFRC